MTDLLPVYTRGQGLSFILWTEPPKRLYLCTFFIALFAKLLLVWDFDYIVF